MHVQHTGAVDALALMGNDLYSASTSLVLTRVPPLCDRGMVLSLPVADLESGACIAG